MSTRGRGRPRRYDPETALDAAMALFWSRGYAATSLDALSEATQMQRPSLYAAFGDKRRLFDLTLARFRTRMRASVEASLSAPEVADALRTAVLAALDTYAPPGETGHGCFVFGVASVGAEEDEQLRAFVAETIDAVDGAFQARIEAAIAGGALPAATNAVVLARMTSCLVHSLSLRARAGTSRRKLRTFARDGVALLLSASSAR